MASVTTICNRALQKLGAKRITNIDDDSVSARACKNCYEELRDSELQKNRWSFAKKRVQLSSSVDTPVFGRGYLFPLPSDFLALHPPDPEDNIIVTRDWIIEAGNIVSDDSGPIDVIYIARTTDATLMDVNFREALSAKMAFEMCEELTQSNLKKEAMRADYDEAISQAKKSNAISKLPAISPESTWVTGRL